MTSAPGLDLVEEGKHTDHYYIFQPLLIGQGPYFLHFQHSKQKQGSKND